MSEQFTHKARLLQRFLNSQEWRVVQEVLQGVVNDAVNDALTCEDPSRELSALHRAQASRLLVNRFTNALAEESGATVEHEETNE